MPLISQESVSEEIIEKMLRDNLFLQNNERLVVLTDYPSAKDIRVRELEILERIIRRNLLARKIVQVAKEKFPKTTIDFLTFPCAWTHYKKIDDELKKKILEYDVVYVISEFAITDQLTRLIENSDNTRAAASPTVDETLFHLDSPLNININKLENEVMIFYSKLNNGKKCRVYTHLGTDITIDLEGARFAIETGIVEHPSKSCNLPAGEVAIHTQKINGKFVVPRGWIEGLTGNLVLDIEQGYIVDMEQKGKNTKWLEKNYKNTEDKKYVIEMFSVGMNEKANNPFNTVELIKMRGVGIVNILGGSQIEYDYTDTNTFTGHFPAPNVYIEIDDELVFKNGIFIIV